MNSFSQYTRISFHSTRRHLHSTRINFHSTREVVVSSTPLGPPKTIKPQSPARCTWLGRTRQMEPSVRASAVTWPSQITSIHPHPRPSTTCFLLWHISSWQARTEIVESWASFPFPTQQLRLQLPSLSQTKPAGIQPTLMTQVSSHAPWQLCHGWWQHGHHKNLDDSVKAVDNTVTTKTRTHA